MVNEMNTKSYKMWVVVSCAVMASFVTGKSHASWISEAKPPASSLSGRLWRGTGNQLPIAGGYVFALSADRREVYGYTQTNQGRESYSGGFHINNLPATGNLVLVGFHPAFPGEMAIKRVSLNGRHEQIIGFLTATISHAGDPGGRAMGSSPLGALALAGWVAQSRMAENQRNEAISLANQLMQYVR